MYDWSEMAVVVGKKLVENGQERILHRIYDCVTSNLFLDVSDFKESDNHKLCYTSFGPNFQGTDIPQRDKGRSRPCRRRRVEAPSAGLGLDPSAELTGISGIWHRDADCHSALSYGHGETF